MSNVLDKENKMNIPFSPPDISEAEIAEVADALRSGWITTGPKTKLLEKKIADYIGTPKCVCLNSQTACAEVSLRILGVGPGDEVITTAYTYTASRSVFQSKRVRRQDNYGYVFSHTSNEIPMVIRSSRIF